MPKQFFQRWLPSAEKVANLKFMRIFGRHTLNPLLWYVNRRSIAKAVFIGTFWGILPVPFHSLFIIVTIVWFVMMYVLKIKYWHTALLAHCGACLAGIIDD